MLLPLREEEQLKLSKQIKSYNFTRSKREKKAKIDVAIFEILEYISHFWGTNNIFADSTTK